jgi:hypothetical protein
VDLNAGYAIGEPFQGAGDERFDLSGQLRAALDVWISVNLNEQGASLFDNDPTISNIQAGTAVCVFASMLSSSIRIAAPGPIN